MNNQAYKALSKVCLNNWHYIDRKVLTLNDQINFFTGHSGSGKSTVIDAIQIVLYANTDGRGFFNKAAADDSDRSLMEYLRGMTNIGESGEATYLRNHNFSTTIVLELQNTITKEQECVGVVFDVDCASNDVTRMFFWHRGALMDRQYRYHDRAMATSEIKEYMQRNYNQEDFFYSANNERFRRQLYDTYLGGLDMEKFPRLFKRAIPFRMNIKLEDFVKEYICMEQDIQIDHMQESVMLYGRMRKKIEDTMDEIRKLEEIHQSYAGFEEKQKLLQSYDYRLTKITMQQLKDDMDELALRMGNGEEELALQEKSKTELEAKVAELTTRYKEVIGRIANSGYDKLETELANVNEFLERLERSRAKWNLRTAALNVWKAQDITPNQTIWDIEKFEKQTINEEELLRLQRSLAQIREEVDEERHDASSRLKSLRKEADELAEELKVLKRGEKGYPKILEEARYELRTRLKDKVGKFVNVHILADLLTIKDETWHDAIEGYLGRNKQALIVEPAYVKAAMELYEELDRKRFHSVSVVDTEKVTRKEHPVREGALAEEVKAKEDYVQSYMNLLLGNVMKCGSVAELRGHRIGVTSDCMLYQNYQLRRMNPDNYTIFAFIGDTSLHQRIKMVEEQKKRVLESLRPLEDAEGQAKRILGLEHLQGEVSEYMQQLYDIKQIPKREKEKVRITEQMSQMQDESVARWKEEEALLEEKQREYNNLIDKVKESIWALNERMDEMKEERIEKNEELANIEKMFTIEPEFEGDYDTFVSEHKDMNYEGMRRSTLIGQSRLGGQKEEAYHALLEIRSQYLKDYPNRSFSLSTEDNSSYDELLNSMQCEELERFKESAKEQARAAVEHFKDDFIFKIRSAIREAYQRRDELNRIIAKLNFGKDRYQFKITKNNGADGEYYKMFMDDSLQIDPSTLLSDMDNQLDLFTMEHETNYGGMMNDLINIFIPPEGASGEELEEAKKNMDKYSDYRTYLSFDMEQIVQGEEKLTIGLSKMISKNSGGEGQNPLYVALLASFAQAYKINLTTKVQRNPTLRLVVLDEAFSKMDSEKVASCIELIRGLGFQAIISATNDKIQNYLENVDKTFVYANPNKKSISIQEFEKSEFAGLETDIEES